MSADRRHTAAGTMEVEILPDAGALAHAAADQVTALARRAIDARGRFTVALSGGTTPGPAYHLLAAEPSAVDWRRVHVYWSDERCVPPEDPRSNYRMAREALLDAVPVPAAQVHRVRGEDPPAQAAAAYEAVLRCAFAPPRAAANAAPAAGLDLVLLGLGEDGHTASLFPGDGAVFERARWVAAVRLEPSAIWRVTLTPVFINAAAHVMFVVSGAAKARRLHEVLQGPRRPEALPAQAIGPTRGRVRWVVDAAAAAGLAFAPPR